MASVDADDDNFAEDECTIEFGEEEEEDGATSLSAGRGYQQVSSVLGGPRYVDYPGEDFSKYLSDTALPQLTTNDQQV